MGKAAPTIGRVGAGAFTLGATEALGAVMDTPKLSTPSPPNAQAPVTTESRAVQEAQAEAVRRRARAKGYQSTMLRSFLEPAAAGGSTEGLKATFGS